MRETRPRYRVMREGQWAWIVMNDTIGQQHGPLHRSYAAADKAARKAAQKAGVPYPATEPAVT